MAQPEFFFLKNTRLLFIFESLWSKILFSLGKYKKWLYEIGFQQSLSLRSMPNWLSRNLVNSFWTSVDQRFVILAFKKAVIYHLNVSSIVIYMVSDKSSIIEFMWCFWWSLGVALSVTLINNFCSISSGASFFKFFGVGRRKKAWSISNAEESGVLWGGHAKEFEKGCLYRKAARV